MKLTNEICISFLLGSGWLYNHDKEITSSERNKALDDFIEKIELKYLGVHPDELYEKYYPREICKQIKEIAEQLKESAEE